MKKDNIESIDLLDTLRALQKIEWNDLGLKEPELCQVINLPDGREDILSRLWKVFVNHRYDAQAFSNDSHFTYRFPENNKIVGDILKLHTYCKKDLIKDHTGCFLSFYVCW
jgi:hypothetical protein